MEDLPKWKHELPSTPHPLLNDAANLLVEFYKEHTRRDIHDGKLTPVNYWALLRGFLIAAMQTYASIDRSAASHRSRTGSLGPSE